MAPVIVCVVLTGTPSALAEEQRDGAGVSAAKPPNGCSLVILLPIVWTMRQPPDSVPSAMAACAARMTQNGIVKRRQQVARRSAARRQ